MSGPDALALENAQRRAFRLAYSNGALWALGNGLGSTALIVYLVRQLGAAGLGIGAVLAAPHISGVLRLAAPAMVGYVANRRNFCISCYGASAVLLALISLLAEPGRLTSPEYTLPLVIGLWCVHHLLEYLATVILWSWLGDIAPVEIRGRFIGMRELFMLLARIAGMLLAGGFVWFWEYVYPYELFGRYAIPAAAGAALMMAALLPLARLPDATRKAASESKQPPSLLRPLADPRMRWLLAFGIWFSIANGLTQSAQFLFPIVALALPLFVRNVYTSGMRLGQAALAPAVGWNVDIFGNKRMLILAQLIVAVGPLFFVLANHTRQQPTDHYFGWQLSWWVLGGAWLVWIAYIGLNIGLPNLMLKLAGPAAKASYVAWYFALTGVVYGVCSILGGALYQWLRDTEPTWSLGSIVINHDDMVFTAGFVLRVLAVLWLLPLQEPTAQPEKP